MKKGYILILVCLFLLTACSQPMKRVTVIQDVNLNENSKQDELSTEVTAPTSEPVVPRSIELLYQYDYWTLYDNSNALFKTKDEYEKALRAYIVEIGELIHKETWFENYDARYKTLYIKLKISGNSGGSITAPVEYTNDSMITYLTVGENLFLNHFNPIIHELTHLISYDPKLGRYGLSISLNDGLAEYVSKQIGGEDTYCIKNIPIHDYLLQYLSTYYQFDVKQDEANSFYNVLAVDELVYRYQPFSLEWMYFFMCNMSFVDYIINEHGIDYFMNLHDYKEDELNIKKQQEQINIMKSEWINFLNTYQCQMTYEEIDSFIQKKE